MQRHTHMEMCTSGKPQTQTCTSAAKPELQHCVKDLHLQPRFLCDAVHRQPNASSWISAPYHGKIQDSHMYKYRHMRFRPGRGPEGIQVLGAWPRSPLAASSAKRKRGVAIVEMRGGCAHKCNGKREQANIKAPLAAHHKRRTFCCNASLF